MSEINELTDKLNALIEQATEVFVQIADGCFAAVDLTTGRERDPSDHADGILWFKKRDKAYGLFVLHEDKVTPLKNASRHIRMQAVLQFDALRVAILAARPRLETELAEAVDTATRFVAQNRSEQ